MVGDSLGSALRALKDERDRLDEAIRALEGLSTAQGARKVSGRRRGPGRPRKLGRPRGVAVTRGGRRRKNAPRGLLRAKIVAALKDAKKPLRAVELRNAIMKSGYPVKNKQTLYSAIFAAAKKEPLVKKTGKGFELK
jgi:hypothetical protein